MVIIVKLFGTERFRERFLRKRGMCRFGVRHATPGESSLFPELRERPDVGMRFRDLSTSSGIAWNKRPGALCILRARAKCHSPGTPGGSAECKRSGIARLSLSSRDDDDDDDDDPRTCSRECYSVEYGRAAKRYGTRDKARRGKVRRDETTLRDDVHRSGSSNALRVVA